MTNNIGFFDKAKGVSPTKVASKEKALPAASQEKMSVADVKIEPEAVSALLHCVGQKKRNEPKPE